jgi:hypothetical protein
MVKGRVIRSQQYRDWLNSADVYALTQRVGRLGKLGAFQAELWLAEDGAKGDADNYVKVVLDWAQRVNLLKNDKMSTKVSVRWVPRSEAPDGCLLILEGEPDG